MPFLRDEGPPISQASIQKLRESLPVEYGWQLVNETGRDVLVVRVPKAKPDYLHDLAEVAFYVGLENVKTAKDVLLVGHEKTARLEPQLLRDHIRAQGREDLGVVDHLRRQLDRQYGHTFVQSPSNHQHTAFAVRIPKETVAQFTPDDVNAIRQLFTTLRARVMDSQYAYVVANSDHERLGRRVLLELIAPPGAEQPAVAPAPPAAAVAAPAAALVPPPAPAAVAAPPTPASTPVPASAAAPSFRFPSATPSAAPAPAAPPAAVAPTPPAMPVAPQPAAVARVAPTPKTPSFIAAAMAAPPAPQPAVAAEPADVTEHEEYTIVSKPKAAAAPPAPAPAPAAPPVAAPAVTSAPEHEEYEIVSKPKAPTASPAPPPAPAPAPAAEHEEQEGKQVLHHDKEFEVFTSKPKPKADTKPSITPPGMGGFQAALHGATSAAAPAKTKEYEIIGRTSVTSDPGFASKLRAPPAAPAPAAPAAPAFAAAPAAPAAPPPMTHAPFPSLAQPAPPAAPVAAPGQAPPPMHLPSFTHAPAPAASPGPAAPPVPVPMPAPTVVEAPIVAVPPRVASTPSLPVADNGAAIVARVAPANPEAILAARFKESGYEVVEGLRAQGTVFAFAAHKPNGRRVLVKRTESFAPEEATALSQLVTALGADVALVVADSVKPGTRLATWGTRIEVVTPADVPALGF